MGFRNRRKEYSNSGYLEQVACDVCQHYMMGSAVYVILMGLIGTITTAFEILRILNCKCASDRLSSRSPDGVSKIPHEVDRDLKLMTSILGIEHYTLIMLGAITEYPMLHTPWLLMQMCVIVVEFVVFCVRIFLDGLHVSRDEVLLSALSIHNWLQVFCLFHRHARRPLP